MKKIDSLIRKIEPPNWVLGILSIIFLLRIPSFFEPYYYGDEMIYLTLGNAIKKGLTLYSQIHDNKPPLLYLTAAFAGNLFWFKAILLFWMLATTVAFWHLTKKLFKDLPGEVGNPAQKIAIIIFAILTTIPLFEGNIVNAELFLIGPIIIALTILLTKNKPIYLFLAGALFSIAALFKIPAIFDVPVIIIFWLIRLENFDSKTIFEIARKTLIIALGFAIPIALTFVWYLLHNAAGDYLRAAFLQNVGYVSSWGGNDNTSFVVKHGPLLLRAGVVIIGLIILRIYNRKLSRPFLLASIWLLTSLFAVTLSERPYPHYMIQAVPAISLLIAILVSSKKFEQVLTVLPLTLAVFVPIYFKFYYYPTSPYYLRFIQFATSQTSKWEFFNKFDKGSEGNYSASQFLLNVAAPEDKVFVWGDIAPVIYALSRTTPSVKYVATYHINDFSSQDKIAEELDSNPPSFIVIPENTPPFSKLNILTQTKYILIYSQFGFTIWHLPAD